MSRHLRREPESAARHLLWFLLVYAAVAVAACGVDNPAEPVGHERRFTVEAVSDTPPNTAACLAWACRDPNQAEFDEMYAAYFWGQLNATSYGSFECYALFSNLLYKLQNGEIFVGENRRYSSSTSQIVGSWDPQDESIYLWQGNFGVPTELALTSLHESSHDMGELQEYRAESAAQNCAYFP